MPRCKALSNHMCITVAGSWRPCCRFNNFPFSKITEVSFDDYRSSEFYQKIKTDMDAGWAEGCKKCQSEEERGHTSLRQVLNRELSGNNDIEYIELSLSNKCNLACKMCGPTYSTTWNKLVEENSVLKEYQSTHQPEKIYVDKVFGNVDIKKLKKIKYLGGEPFITSEIRDLFEFLNSKNVISQIEFECNTNCTLFPKKWLYFLSKFKKVNIELSIDGTDQLNDYIRYGKTWNNDIYPNILEWVEYAKHNPNINLSIFTTVQAYNLHNVKSIKELADRLGIKFYSSLLVVPNFLSVNVLPQKYLEEIRDDYNEKYYKSITDQTELFGKLKKFTTDMDAITKINIRDIIPKLYNYMEKHND